MAEASKPATRRSNGEGTVGFFNGRWMARLRLPDGRRRTLYGTSRAEVVRKLDEERRLLALGKTTRDRHLTLGEYVDEWLAGRRKVREATLRADESRLRNHVVPVLGRVRLSRLRPEDLSDLYSALQTPRPGHAALSSTTVRHLHFTIRNALGQAVRLGYLLANPADLVEPPRQAEHEMHPLSQEQAARVLEAARGGRLEALYVLALHTGMRQGELLGLRWRDVDLDAGALSITGSQQRDRGLSIGPTKNSRSRRQVHLSGSVVEALRAHKARQAQEQLAAARWSNREGRVFTTTAGTPLSPQNLMKRSFKPLLERAGVPEIRFHDLRHTVATLLLSRGHHAKYVSELLGHSSISVTLDIYSHVTAPMSRETADVMDSLLSRSPETGS